MNERPKTNPAKVAMSCLWLLVLIGSVTAVMTAAIVVVVRVLS